MTHIVCSGCSLRKPREAFYPKNIKKSDDTGRCKVCLIQAATEYARRNRDKINAQQKKRWREKHPLISREPLETEEGRLCRTCGERKSHDAFARDPRAKNNKAWRCRDCARRAHAKWTAENIDHVRDVARGNSKKSRQRNKPKNAAVSRRWWWKKMYGLSEEDIRKMLLSQSNACGICTKPLAFEAPVRNPLRINVDHCHTTGRVRGLLCLMCNTGIGKLLDDPALLRRAADYLEASRGHGRS